MKLEPIIQSEVSQKDKDHYNILPLQHSCLENSMDRGDWLATIHAFSQTQLSTHMHTHTHTHTHAQNQSTLFPPNLL